MKAFGNHISTAVQNFFLDSFNDDTSLDYANHLIQSKSGIESFFETLDDLREFNKYISTYFITFEESDRPEYGDYQTNKNLAINVLRYLSISIAEPNIIVEPTCGKGNFILSALQTFDCIKKIYGVEIHKPYVWETKFSILDFFLENWEIAKPEINIIHCSVFDFDFNTIASDNFDQELLIIGNPPWVTNSVLGGLNSFNLPVKSNFKNHKGLDAMTGKGNFDIAESITSLMLEAFQNMNGNMALLIKNSVIKNIVYDQKKNKYNIDSIEKHCIDSKKEFDVSVDASLFFCKLNSLPSYKCVEFDFYDNSVPLTIFGWVEEKFVSNVETYSHSINIDGICPFVWRQGLKHDCSSIMELDKISGNFSNSLNEEVELESDLIYGLLKSSDLKNEIINFSRKYTIVTQRKVGQDTSYIQNDYPKTYKYLKKHLSYFNARKSSIYKNKPYFSIFGIGDYSFKPYKVVISGLYKTFHFTLAIPENKKPLMLDDTCYMLSFDNMDYAVYTFILLNSDTTKELLKSITFSDAKRTFTKEVLMRIDLQKISYQFDIELIKSEMGKLNERYGLGATFDNWYTYRDQMKPLHSGQTNIFA